jgi:hypothetical protein
VADRPRLSGPSGEEAEEVSRSSTKGRRSRDRRPLVLLFFGSLLVACVVVGRPVVAGAAPGGRLVAEPILSGAAAGARQLFGASPEEAPGEVWGVGTAPDQGSHIIRYTEATGWESMPDPIDEEGTTVALPTTSIPATATAGRTTPQGGVVAVAEFGEGEDARQELIVRDPGGPLRLVDPPETVLAPESGEHLFLQETEPRVLLAAIGEADGKTGALVAPSPGSAAPVTSILHYDGSEWSREPICLETLARCELEPEPPTAAPQPGFKVLAIDASGPGQAWMLGRQKNLGIALFKREPGARMWVLQEPAGALGTERFNKARPTVGGVAVSITGRETGQPLTVTSKGVWVDAEISFKGRPFGVTLYYDVGEGDPRQGEYTGSWCDPPEGLPEETAKALCEFPLGAGLPTGESRSFAWPPTDPATEPYGRRAITGVGLGAMLLFENGAFSKIPLSGSGGTSAGAALTYSDEAGIGGWLGPSYRLTREPVPSGLEPWPVPFRRPLLAVAPQPGVPVGELSSQALAVGAGGEVARYLPGVGWQAESLLSGSGVRATPDLRGVAWPTPSFAYAVGDEGAMWMWRASTGLWEPDPGAPPNLIRGNFTGIAFAPEEPERGYAVGKQGLLLEYGKRWTQAQLPTGVSPEINITSIAFAGHEALATWTLAVSREGYVGGLLVNEGSGWRTEETAAAALAEVEKGLAGTAPRRVAGLPDGGAVIVGTRGGVIEREAEGAPWHAVPGGLVGYPDTVTAIREGGQVRAVISVSGLESQWERDLRTDSAQAIGQPPEGQAPLLTEPYPLPEQGFLIRQTATGWRDEQRQDLSAAVPELGNLKPETFPLGERPAEPDPVLALMLNSEGSEGWAVGGQTGEGFETQGPYVVEGVQTSTAERYGPAAAPPSNAGASTIPVAAGEATFAVGGGVPCETSCADRVNLGIGPQVWLPAAVGRAAAIPGVRGFLYAGGGVSRSLDPTKVSAREFTEEEGTYAGRLGIGAGGLPVFPVPAPSDRYGSSMTPFEGAFAGYPQPLGGGVANPRAAPYSSGEREVGNYSYSFTSVDETGVDPVRVIVIDESVMPLPTVDLCWLSGQLAAAKREGIAAIVAGDREVGAEAELGQVLVTGASAACPQAEPGSASAYFYGEIVNSSSGQLEEVEGNVSSTLVSGPTSIPAFGTGSLGFLEIANPALTSQEPASGFLLASVGVAGRSPTTNIAPVSVRLIPNISSLAINAVDGTLLRRSQTATFEALARRPIAGAACGVSGGRGCGPDPYVQIPSRCVAGKGYRGRPCGLEIQPEYRFTSSRPDIANFVEVDPTSTDADAVFLDANGKPVPDPTSGLLCTFNSGTTIVSIETGGLSYSVPVVVQPGSVARPCGTVPRTDLAAEEKPLETPLPPLETEPGFKPGPENLVPPPPNPTAPQPVIPQVTSPIPPAPVHPVQPHPVPKPVPQPLQPPFFVTNPTIAPIPVIIPPAPPAAAEPAPPTGTSPVTQPAVSPEPEEEEEAAFDLVHHAVAYPRGDRGVAAVEAAMTGRGGGFPSSFLPALVLLAAVACAGVVGPRVRSRPDLAFQTNRPKRRPFDGFP